MLGEKLRKLRLEKGMTQKDIAELLEVTPKAISAYELDNREPSLENLKALASYFNVTTDYLLDVKRVNNIKQLALFPEEGYKVIKTKGETEFLVVKESEKESDYLSIKIKNDKNSPYIEKEDIAIIKKSDFEEGMSLIEIEEKEEIYKIKKEEKGIWLIPENPKYRPEFLAEKEIEKRNLKIVGKVIEVRKK